MHTRISRTTLVWYDIFPNVQTCLCSIESVLMITCTCVHVISLRLFSNNNGIYQSKCYLANFLIANLECLCGCIFEIDSRGGPKYPKLTVSVTWLLILATLVMRPYNLESHDLICTRKSGSFMRREVKCQDIEHFLLQWRHNERDGVSDHRRLNSLLGRLFRRRLKETSNLRVTGLCEGHSMPPFTKGQ